MSDTPRTDAILTTKDGGAISLHGNPFSSLEGLCRQLERELAALRAENEALRRESQANYNAVRNYKVQLFDSEAELARLKDLARTFLALADRNTDEANALRDAIKAAQ